MLLFFKFLSELLDLCDLLFYDLGRPLDLSGLVSDHLLGSLYFSLLLLDDRRRAAI